MKNIVLLLCAILFSAPIWAQDHAGRIVKVLGEAKLITLDGEEKNIHLGDYVHEGEQLETGKSSMVKLLMNDDTLFHIGPQSHFVVEQFRMITKSDRKAVYQILKGKMRSLFTIKAEKDNLKIKTPNIAMGVRGTEIVSDIYLNGDDRVQTDVALVSGKLEIESLNSNNDEKMIYDLEAGEMLRAKYSENKKNDVENKIKLQDSIMKSLKGGEFRGKLFLHDALKESGLDSKAKFDFVSQRLKFKRKSIENRAPASVDFEKEASEIKLSVIAENYSSIHENIADAMRAAVEQVVVENSVGEVDEDSDLEALKIARKKFGILKDEIVSSTAQEAAEIAAKEVLSKVGTKFGTEADDRADIAREAKGLSEKKASILAVSKLNDKGNFIIKGQVESEIYLSTKSKVQSKTSELALEAALKAAKKSTAQSDLLMQEEVMKLAQDLAQAAAEKASTIAASKAVKIAAASAVAKAMKEVSNEIVERSARIAAEKAASEAVRRSQQNIKREMIKGNIKERARLPAQVIQKKMMDSQIKETVRQKAEEQLKIQQTEYNLQPQPGGTCLSGSACK